jgi:hypothetical protein
MGVSIGYEVLITLEIPSGSVEALTRKPMKRTQPTPQVLGNTHRGVKEFRYDCLGFGNPLLTN